MPEKKGRKKEVKARKGKALKPPLFQAFHEQRLPNQRPTYRISTVPKGEEVNNRKGFEIK